MNHPPDTTPPPGTAQPPASAPPASHLVRWVASYAAYGVPQAAAPIAFSLVALPLTGSSSSGAALILAMTLAQVVGAVPVSRLGARWNPSSYLRVLVAFRTLALVGVAVLAWTGAGFPLLVAGAALAGLVAGAAYGYQRSLLNHLVVPSGLPRALGIAATLNEVNFVASPVVAALLGAVAPVAAIVLFAVVGAAPLVLIPRVPNVAVPASADRGTGPLVTRAVAVWLCCAAASGAAVAAVEIGAVPFAVHFGLGASLAFVFTVALCLASVAGGLWVSIRNRPFGDRTVLGFLGATVVGSGLVASQVSVAVPVAGALVVGAFLAPLGTHYSLVLDRLAPPTRRAEVFSLLRTSTAVGLILASGLIAAVPLRAALASCTALALVATVAVAWAGRSGASPDPSRGAEPTGPIEEGEPRTPGPSAG